MDVPHSSLAMVLAPLTAEQFLDEYWEQTSVHLNRNDANYFESLVSLHDIESLLSTNSLSFPSVQLTQSASPVNASEYTDESRRINPKQLVQRYHEGATVVLSQAHEKFTKLAEFKRNVQSSLQLRCQTNVYLSPPGKQGFNPHYDSHDVLILQVAGTKTFNIYEGGVELPFAHESFQTGVHECGVLKESIVVEPGDTLYIPRGVMHDAVARDTTSLHITLGVYAITLQDVMLEMLQRTGEQQVGYRRSLPRACLLGKTDDRRLPDEVKEKCLALDFTEDAFHQAVSNLLDDVAMGTTQDVAGLLNQPLVDELDDETEVRFYSAALMSVVRDEDRIRCRVQGQVMEFSGQMSIAIQQLLDAEWIRLGDVSALDHEEKMTLCYQLINANLLGIRR